ncbi:hypothetical protein LINPERPRIM_LOCUS13628 [Linum perenne]
MDTLTSSTR